MAAPTRSLLSRQRRWPSASSWHPAERVTSWFSTRLAFDLDLSLYFKLERTDFPECRLRHVDTWCYSFQFDVMTHYDGDDHAL